MPGTTNEQLGAALARWVAARPDARRVPSPSRIGWVEPFRLTQALVRTHAPARCPTTLEWRGNGQLATTANAVLAGGEALPGDLYREIERIMMAQPVAYERSAVRIRGDEIAAHDRAVAIAIDRAAAFDGPAVRQDLELRVLDGFVFELDGAPVCLLGDPMEVYPQTALAAGTPWGKLALSAVSVVGLASALLVWLAH